MSEIAYYLGDTIIYWNALLIVCSVITALLLGLAFYLADHKYAINFMAYTVLSLVLSIFLSRLIYWYCNMEQYDSFRQAMMDLSDGGFCIVGVLWGTYLPAFVLWGLRLTGSPYDLLDAAAPGIAFILSIIRFGDGFTNACRGKFSLKQENFFHLPFGAELTMGEDTEYRFAAYFVSFLLLLVIAILVTVFHYTRSSRYYPDKVWQTGHTYRLFLLLYSMTEVVIDSVRYDSIHLFFYGEKLSGLNKGASFIGLSQMVALLTLIGLLVFYSVMSRRTGSRKQKCRLLTAGSIAGILSAGVCEYLVQRYTGSYLRIYILQSLGVLLTGSCIFLQLLSCEKRSARNNNN